MLGYRHGFHAGNHADVLKHIVLLGCLERLAKKEAPFLYVDTHAGAGAYRLREGYAAANEEWAGGIDRLKAFAAVEAAPRAAAAYLEFVDAYESTVSDGRGPAYPGSPAVAAAATRPGDRLALFELHPSDYGPLAETFAGDRRISVRNADGFSGLRGLLPPAERRGLVLMDPSYELAADYDRVVDAVGDSLKRFATGVYAVWYPLLERPEAKRLPGRLLALGAAKALDARLRVRAGSPGQRGMAGSGMVVLNPPWLLKEELEATLPYLSRALSLDSGAAWSIEANGLD